MNEELINFMFKTEKAKFKIEELDKSTFSFIGSVQMMLEQYEK